MREATVDNLTPGQPRFLSACRGETVDRTPVWVMRQAGRYLPEYLAIRAKNTFREVLRSPELSAEVTLQPLRRFRLDAAIIFSDILSVTGAMGVPFQIVKGKGPVMEHTVRTVAEVEKLRLVEPAEDLGHLLEAIRMVTAELGAATPLIGFSGAPFTLACYIVEGGPSKDFRAIRKMMFREPGLARDLLDRIADSVIALLRAQVAAGARAVQVFESWASVLSPAQYAAFAAPATTKVLNGLEDLGVPRILFTGGTGLHLDAIAESPADVLGVDWRVSLSRVHDVAGLKPLQGNLDPCALYLKPGALKSAVSRVLVDADGLPGHVFNLGHGISPDVDPDQMARLVDYVHELSAA